MKLIVKYPNLTLLGLSVLVAVLLSHFDVIDKVLGDLGRLGYLGAFVT